MKNPAAINRQPTKLRITVLGSGSILCTARRNPPGYLVQDPVTGTFILLDPGPGTWARLPHAGVDPRQIDRVLITHLHVDHHADLLALLFARYNPEWRQAGLPRLHIGGPPEVARVLAAWKDLYGDPVDDQNMEFHPLAPGGHSFEHLLLKVAPAAHSDEALSYHFNIPGYPSFCFTGDTAYSPELVVLARDVNLLLCECSHPDANPLPGHMTPKQAARLAREAQVKNLVLTHFYPVMDEIDVLGAVHSEWDGPVFLAKDLETFEL